MNEQVVVTAAATGLKERALELISDEAIQIAWLTAAGIGTGIGLVGLARLIKRRPKVAGPELEEWRLLMERIATFGGMLWIFALNMIFLDGRYGWLAKIVVASAPSIMGGYMTPLVYNRVHRYLKKRAASHTYDELGGK